MKKPQRPAEKVPVVYVHVHLTAVEPTSAADLIPLRDAIRDLVREYADVYGLRIKRRRVSVDTGGVLAQAYEQRSKLFTLID